MLYRLFYFLAIVVIAFSCEENNLNIKEGSDLPKTRLVIDLSSVEIHRFDESNEMIDSVLLDIERFSDFRASIEDLSNLNPKGLSPFLYNAIVHTNQLLEVSLPAPFETPDIRSRLKVVKTQLLRVNHYSIEKEYDTLNASLVDLYQAYNAYLQRIEDFSKPSFSATQIDLAPRMRLE